MNPRNAGLPRDERTKREELKTYKELDLRRDLKSAAQRRRVEASGRKRVLGDGSLSQPYLIVDSASYRAVRLEVQRGLLLEARRAGLALPVDALLQQLKPRIEALAYTRLAAQADHDSLRGVTVAALGRTLTATERACFADTSAAGAGDERARNRPAQNALNLVLGAIEQRQSHNPARHQAIWADVVGLDAAQQTSFVGVDAATQTAWFRCTNSVLSADLQRRKGLGLPVRQLRARF
jgi:hypothetical protein